MDITKDTMHDLQTYARNYWRKHKLVGDGWEDALSDFFVELVSRQLPVEAWHDVLTRILDKHRKQYIREKRIIKTFTELS